MLQNMTCVKNDVSYWIALLFFVVHPYHLWRYFTLYMANFVA